ncbi:MAG: fluoride efflux transporter CrcB [Bacteroidota bacterium]
MSGWQQAALVALGGAGGALARYGVALASARWTATGALAGLPVGTWVANIAGCFLIGLALPFVPGRDPLRLLGVVGFLGGFTTFSSYSAETLALLETGRVGWALVNALGSVAVGLVAAWAGWTLARTFA